MLKSPCTRLKAELYNAAGFFGPLSPGPSLDIIDIPKWFTQVSSTTAFSESHSCKATLSQQDQQKYSVRGGIMAFSGSGEKKKVCIVSGPEEGDMGQE